MREREKELEIVKRERNIDGNKEEAVGRKRAIERHNETEKSVRE